MKGKKTGGRKPGSKNKVTTTVKKGVLETFVRMQKSRDYNMWKWAKENQTEFFKIASKLIPIEVTAELTGKNGEALFKVYTGIDLSKMVPKK